MNGIDKAIDLAGGQSGLARLLTESRKAQAANPDAVTPVSQANVHYWKNKSLPAKVAIEIELVLASRVTRYELLPDIFGPPAMGSH